MWWRCRRGWVFYCCRSLRPLRDLKLLISHLIDGFSHPTYEQAGCLYPSRQQLSISMSSLHSHSIIYAFSLIYFLLLMLFIVFFSICRTQVFVRQGALCCQQQESKIANEDGAVKEWRDGTRWGLDYDRVRGQRSKAHWMSMQDGEMWRQSANQG